MATDSTRIEVGADPTPITHGDTDYQTGHTFIARCDTATVYYGGPEVTPETGYDKPAGVEFGLTDTADTAYACVAPADTGAVLKVFWVGV